MSRAWNWFLLILMIPSAVLAQTLADKLPASTVIYVGFKGSDALKAQYQGSHLQGMIENTDLDLLVSDQFAQKLANLIARENPAAADQISVVISSLRQMWHYPSAIAVTIDSKDDHVLAVLCNAGDASADLTRQLSPLVTPRGDIQVRQIGPMVLLSVGRSSELQSFLASQPVPASTLAQDAAFRSALKQVDASGAVVAYVNAKTLADWWLRVGPAHMNPNAAKTRTALGLDTLQTIAFSGTFLGKDWSTRAFLAAPSPRTGLLALFDGQPASPDLLKLVPVNAAKVSVTSLDFAALLEQLRGSLKQYDPQLAAQLEQGLVMSQGFLQTDVTKDLFPALGPNWVIYTDSAVGSVHPLGSVFINVLRNPQQAETSLTNMQTALLTIAAAQLEKNRMAIAATSRQVNGTQIHTINLPLVAPSWAIRDGKLYIAAYPQLVAAAASFPASGGKTFADNPQFAAFQKQQSVTPLSISYADMRQLAAGGYGNALLLTRYAGFLDLFGVPTPTMPLPPLPQFQQHASSPMAITWSDPAGWHLQAVSPCPGSTILSQMMGPDVATFQGPLAASILLPSLARAREKANEVKCASNMRQIGMGIILFAQDHQGQYPTDLGEILVFQDMPVEVFTCPSGRQGVPPQILHASREEQAKWVTANSPYVYLGEGLMNSSNPKFVVLYEKIEDHGEGVNILFADGHVEFMTPDRLRQALDHARNLGQQLPDDIQN